MKISQFVTNAIGLIYSMSAGNLVTLAIFGIGAIISAHRLMRELEDTYEDPNWDEEFTEGSVEPWERAVQEIQHAMRKS